MEEWVAIKMRSRERGISVSRPGCKMLTDTHETATPTLTSFTTEGSFNQMSDAGSKQRRPSVSDIIAAARKTPIRAKLQETEPHTQSEDGWTTMRSRDSVTYSLTVPEIDVARFKQGLDLFWKKLLAVSAKRPTRQDALYLELDLVNGAVYAKFSGSRPLGGKPPRERDESATVNIHSVWIESETDDIFKHESSAEAEAAALGQLESSILQMIVEAFRALHRQEPAAVGSLADAVGVFAHETDAKDLFELRLFDDRVPLFSAVPAGAPIAAPHTDQEVAAIELEKLAPYEGMDVVRRHQGVVVEVCLSRSAGVTDETLKYLMAFPKLEKLFLNVTSITNEGLACIGQLTTLKRLDLSGTRITDEGLARLANLKKLFELDLRSTQVTAAGVKKLRPALPAIKRLMVD